MDTYEVGNIVRRWGKFYNHAGVLTDPRVATFHVTDPRGCLHIQTSNSGNVARHERGVYSWDAIASQVGDWIGRWFRTDKLIVLPDGNEPFEVVERLIYPDPKPFPTLSDGDDLELHPLAPEHLELVRGWRNHDDIRRWFFAGAVIDAYQQQKWYYERYLPDVGDLMWIAHYNGQPVGTGALTHIDLAKHEAEWSRLIIGENVARGKGLAHRIAALVRDYGLDCLGLERIYGSLYTANHITMHIDMAAGYIPYAIEGEITHVELLRKDWR
jgi:RimJ/RimL family protein N-acetyltransferase